MPVTVNRARIFPATPRAVRWGQNIAYDLVCQSAPQSFRYRLCNCDLGFGLIDGEFIVAVVDLCHGDNMPVVRYMASDTMAANFGGGSCAPIKGSGFIVGCQAKQPGVKIAGLHWVGLSS